MPKRPPRRETIVWHEDGSCDHFDHDTNERWVTPPLDMSKMAPAERQIARACSRPMTATSARASGYTVH